MFTGVETGACPDVGVSSAHSGCDGSLASESQFLLESRHRRGGGGSTVSGYRFGGTSFRAAADMSCGKLD